MRDILLGPFGSMGSLNVKLRNICVEDLILEGIFACLSIVRIVFSTRLYELIGAVGSFIGTSMIACVAGILVMDGSCCAKPVCTFVTDWKLMTVYHTISYAGIVASVLAIICEIMTLLDQDESSSTAIDLPVEIGEYGRIREREIAITVLIIQVFLSIPWRIYAIRVIRGVLEAIHCAEVLKFPSQYDRKILEDLMPTTGAPHGVEIAVESDIPVLAVLQYQAFSAILRHIGLPPDRGPALIEAQWRAKGPAVLKWWLGRVGVVRDTDGHVIGALSLQLPGDTAAYRARMVSHEAIDSSTTRLRPTSSSVDESTNSHHENEIVGDASHHFAWPERQVGCLERMIGPEYVFLGLMNGYRYRYKHAIMNDHVCTPGEAYVEFVCTLAGREGEGIGTRLMKWAEQSAEKLGCGRIRLTVMDNDERLRLRYLKYGYSVCSSWTDPIDKMFKKYGFGINENGYCEMEKPLLVDQGKAIHSRTYGFASDHVRLSGSFEDDADISLHAAAQSIIAGTRDLMNSAQNFISRRNQGGVASWAPLESCFQEFSDVESNFSSRDALDCNPNCLNSSTHSVSGKHTTDNVGFPDVSSGSTSSLQDNVVKETVFSPVRKLGGIADPSVGFGAKFSSSGSHSNAGTSWTTPVQLSASSSGSDIDSNGCISSPGALASNTIVSSVSRDRGDSPALRANSESPHTFKDSAIVVNAQFGKPASSPTKNVLRSASPGQIPADTTTSPSVSATNSITNTCPNNSRGDSTVNNDKTSKSEGNSSGVMLRSSSGDSIESSSSSHSSNSSGHGSRPSGSNGSIKRSVKVTFAVTPLTVSNSALPLEFKGKLLSRSSVNDENNISQPRLQNVDNGGGDAVSGASHSTEGAIVVIGANEVQSRNSGEASPTGAGEAGVTVSGGESRSIDGRALGR